MPDKPLKDCTNVELMEMAIPGFVDQFRRALADNPNLLHEVELRMLRPGGFDPISATLGDFD